jgi:GT2 family glycosyltransferase
MPPTVAICIPTFNQAQYLEEAVASALKQNHPATEIWISDDASTDDTAAVLIRLAAQHPEIRAHTQPINLGLSGNMRWLLGQPHTNYLVNLHSDDHLHADYVGHLLELFEQHAAAGYGHASVHEIDRAGRKTKVRSLARDSGFVGAEEALRAAVSGYRVAANICMFRRSALQAVDYFKQDMPFAEDWDLSVRLADAGWGNVYCRETLAEYRVWDDPKGVRPRRKMAEIEGITRVFEESLEPAFARRGWPLDSLRARREQLALQHCDCLGSKLFSEAEKAAILRLLMTLGDSPALAGRAWRMQHGFAPWYRAVNDARGMIRQLAKRVLCR